VNRQVTRSARKIRSQSGLIPGDSWVMLRQGYGGQRILGNVPSIRAQESLRQGALFPRESTTHIAKAESK
jgi:hypothetical protein